MQVKGFEPLNWCLCLHLLRAFMHAPNLQLFCLGMKTRVNLLLEKTALINSKWSVIARKVLKPAQAV